MICTSSLAGTIKVLEGGLLTESEIFFCPLEEPAFVKRAIFNIIPAKGNKVNLNKTKEQNSFKGGS